jgi:hypothetical protein
VGSRAGLDFRFREKYLASAGIRTPDRLALSLVTIPPEVSLLLFYGVMSALSYINKTNDIKLTSIYMLCRQMYTALCYLTQFLLNAAQHVSSLYKALLQGLFC